MTIGGVETAKLHIMISTDLAVQGLDVPNVSHVINFDLPIEGNGGYNAYMHRGGRAGRLDRRGKVMLLVTSNQGFVLEQLVEKLLLDLECMARQEG
jgi:ATP-dependent RNA helicase DeaD